MKKVIIIILVLAAIAVALFFVVRLGMQIKKERDADLQKSAELAEQLAPYNERVDEIDEEISQLEHQLDEEVVRQGMVNMIFTEPDKELDEGAIEDLEQSGYKGIIAVSKEAFPGDKGMLSVSRIKKLCDKGWSIALYADVTESGEKDGASKTDFTKDEAKALRSLKQQVKKAGLPAAEAIFTLSKPGDEIKEVARELEIPSIIFYRTMLGIDDMDDLLNVSATGLSSSDRSEYRKVATEDGYCCIYAVGNLSNETLYTKARLKEILDFLKDYVNDGTISVMSPQEAYDYYTQYEDDKEKREQSAKERIRELTQEEEELKEKMRELRKSSQDKGTVPLS